MLTEGKFILNPWKSIRPCVLLNINDPPDEHSIWLKRGLLSGGSLSIGNTRHSPLLVCENAFIIKKEKIIRWLNFFIIRSLDGM
jgi:hypothetical protein